MAQEDCSSVLEHFIHDAANLPLEINHLMEEIQAKDKIIQECRAIVNARDNNLQKFIKLNGSLTPNPKEEQYSKTILQNMDRSQILQDEKIALSEKAAILLDRQIKKLDVRVRDLVNDGVLSNDPPIPSLFDSKERPRDLPKSFFPTETTSTDTAASPLNPTAGNTSILNAAQRLANHSARASSASAVTPVAATARNSAPSTPSAATLQLQQRQRESSAGAADNKRRRLNPSLGSLPAASSNLRQSSLGPGTPKVATPGSSRAGSAGPRTTTVTKKASTKKVAPHQQVKKIKASSHMNGKITKRSSSTVRLKPTTGNAAGTNKNSPSAPGEEEEDESILSSVDVSETENAGVRRPGANGEHESDEEMEDDDEEGGEDTKTYCTCQSVSHGDMVACDNDDCPYEWFHWKCVGLTREPLGTWYCDECRKTLGK